MQNSRCMRRNPRWTKTFFAAEPPANLSFCFKGISTAVFPTKNRRVQKQNSYLLFSSTKQEQEKNSTLMHTVDKFGITSTLYTERRKTKREGEEPRVRICKPFKEPRNRFPAWRAGATTLFIVYRPAGLHWFAEPIPQHRFLGYINVYKYGLCQLTVKGGGC